MDKEKIKQIIQEQTRQKTEQTIPRQVLKQIKGFNPRTPVCRQAGTRRATLQRRSTKSKPL